MSALGRLAALALIALSLAGCSRALRGGGDVLGEQEALALAVGLANEACEARYQRSPFAADNYGILFAEGRWRWGRLDPAGPRGYSATVSFDARGEAREVEVFFSHDAVPTRPVTQ
ncbi:MAG: hypothetical protein R3C71_11610 [Candidatus Krumholzibacteriia bacterium]|nr:hypothetical protein [Candidatus Latescibacterota bacterium]MCB9516631.1 hypothetical protein [Candidatus Latescibacterota bacterium]